MAPNAFSLTHTIFRDYQKVVMKYVNMCFTSAPASLHGNRLEWCSKGPTSTTCEEEEEEDDNEIMC